MDRVPHDQLRMKVFALNNPRMNIGKIEEKGAWGTLPSKLRVRADGGQSFIRWLYYIPYIRE